MEQINSLTLIHCPDIYIYIKLKENLWRWYVPTFLNSVEVEFHNNASVPGSRNSELRTLTSSDDIGSNTVPDVKSKWSYPPRTGSVYCVIGELNCGGERPTVQLDRGLQVNLDFLAKWYAVLSSVHAAHSPVPVCNLDKPWPHRRQAATDQMRRLLELN